MRDPIAGEDYLIDYYSILGVERGASQEDIQRHYRAKQMQYHPDRFQGLASELLRQAERRVELLNEAYEVLGDPDKRSAYDSVLANWKKAISTDGTPIIDLGAEGFSFASLLDSVDADPETREKEAETLALQFSGFNKATYDLICKLAESPEGLPPDMKAAYAEQLERRDTYLALREGMLWQSIDVQNYAPVPQLAYGDQLESALNKVRKEAGDSFERQALLLTSGERSLLLPAPEGAASIDSGSMIAEHRARLDQHFEQQSALMRPLAAEREKILNARFKLEAELTYHPDTVEFTTKLLIEVRAKTKTQWLSFEIDPKTMNAKSIPEIAELLSDPEVQSDRIAAGYTILSFKPLVGVDFMSQLECVMVQHVERLQTNDQKTANG